MANISNMLNNIKNAIYGKDVRGSIHDGIDAINKETENTTNRQTTLEGRQNTLDTKFEEQIKNMTLTDPSSAEIVAMRTDKDGVTHDLAGKRIDKIETQMDDMTNETRSKRIQGENTKEDSRGTFDSANFAGQDLGANAPIGNVMHHYTDGIAFQIDNVGENNKILILKNAYNPNRRPDKAEDFVGNGDFLTCLEGVYNSLSKNLFSIGRDGNLYWFDKNDTVTLGSNKDDDDTPLMRIVAYKKHKQLLQLLNSTGGYELTISHINDMVQIQSGNYASKGMKISSAIGVLDLDSEGDINLNPKTKRVNIHAIPYVYEGTNYNRCVTVRSGATNGRPTTGLYSGMMYLDVSLGSNGKPIWYNGSNWIDAMGNIV